jgi:AraC-like DNA-binding protein
MKNIKYSRNNGRWNIEIKKCNNSIHSSKAHFHNEISIGLIEKGSTKTEINGNTYELHEKTFLIIPSDLTHKCNPYDYKNWNFRMLYLTREWFKAAFNIQGEKIKFDYMKIDEGIFSDLINLTDRIESEVINIENEIKLINYISLLINKSSLEDIVQENPNVNKVNEIKKYIENNYLKNIFLDDLAEIAKVSKYYLIRKFNEYYGLSPHQYITNLRINHAKKLLKNNLEFADIALDSGFYDQSHFIKSFKEYTGVTPMNYKS